MPHAVEMLRLRKNTPKSPLQICFCAATMKNFIGNDIYKVTKQEVEEVDIADVCDTIITGLSTSEDRSQFTLYQSSQLMYGALRVFKEQVSSAEEYCKNLFSKVIIWPTVQAECKNAKKTKQVDKKNTKTNKQPSDPVVPEDLSNFDIIDILSRDLGKDVHLMDEIEVPQTLIREPELSFGFSSTGASVEREMSILCSEIVREEQNPIHALSVINIPQAELPQKSNTLLEPFGDENLMNEQRKLQNQKTSTGQNVLRTPKPTRAYPIYGLPASQSASSSESARTAFSPSTKRLDGPRILPLASSTPAKKRAAESDNDETMPVAVPMMDAELPETMSAAQPPFEAAVAPSLPLLMSPEPEVTALPSTVMEVEQLDNNDLQLQQSTVNTNIRRPKRKKKIVIDEIIRMDFKVEPHAKIFTTSLRKRIKLNLYKKEPVQSLLKLPTTLKQRFYHKDARSWARCLLDLYNEIIRKPCQIMEQQHVEEGEAQALELHHSPPRIILKEFRIVLHRVKVPDDSNMLAKDNASYFEVPQQSGIESDVTEPIAQPEPMDYDGPEDEHNQIVTPTLKRSKPTFEYEMEPLTEEAVISTFATESGLFETIQMFWDKIERCNKNQRERVKVAFDAVVDPRNVYASEAIRCLIHCFNLEKKRKLYLEQEKPYVTLYIVKP